MNFFAFLLPLAVSLCYVCCSATSGDSTAVTQQERIVPTPELVEPEFSRLSFEDFVLIYNSVDPDAYLSYLKNWVEILSSYVEGEEMSKRRRYDQQYVHDLVYYAELGARLEGTPYKIMTADSPWKAVDASRSKYIAYLQSLESILKSKGIQKIDEGANNILNLAQQNENSYVTVLKDEVQKELETSGDAVTHNRSSVEPLPGDLEFFFQKYNTADPKDYVAYITNLTQITDALSHNATLPAEVKAKFAEEFMDYRRSLSALFPGQLIKHLSSKFDIPAAVAFLENAKAELEKSDLSSDWAKLEEYKSIVSYLHRFTNKATTIPTFVPTPLPTNMETRHALPTATDSL